MSRWNESSDFYSENRARPGRDFFGRNSRGEHHFERWIERARDFVKSRTADHWLMFIGGLLIGALLG
ncbi:MAG: hypothetical protein Tsb0032_20120 [Kiloniellaceae bacterium]